jgi:HD superfamily phosphohydrolase
VAPAWTAKIDELSSSLFGDSSHWPKKKIVHDSVWGTRAFEGWEMAIIDLPVLQRLRNIHQTSLAYLTFPTALHTRFDHSLGVCSGTKELASKVLGLSKCSPIYRELSAAALLHDIGHGPFSHLTEDSYAAKPRLFADLIYSTEAEKEAPYPRGSPHEIIGALLLRAPAARTFFTRLQDRYDVDIDVEQIGDIIAGNRIRHSPQAASLVNGPFDADKIDYLRRDSAFSGVPIALDFDRLVHSLQMRSEQDLKEVAINIRGVVAAEQILFGKATLFSTVYHHHKVRAADCLFKAITERMFESGLGIDGDPFEDPVDMLRFVDSDFTKWIARKPNQDEIRDNRLRHLLNLLARRDLPVRVMEISTRSLEDEGLQELFRFRDPKPEEANRVYAQVLELRKAIAKEVRNKTGDTTLYEDEVWIDLPRVPDLGDGTLIDKSGDLKNLAEVFPTKQWVDYYKLHRYSGYVLGPRRHLESVRAATARVLQERGIQLKMGVLI